MYSAELESKLKYMCSAVSKGLRHPSAEGWSCAAALSTLAPCCVAFMVSFAACVCRVALRAVRAFFIQVHLSTHDSINRNTAKASLQQMLSVVFARMEAKDTQLKEVRRRGGFCRCAITVDHSK